MPTRQIRTVEPHLDSDILRIIEKKSSPNHPITSSELLLALRKLGYGGSGRSLRDHLSHLCGLNSLLRAVGRNGRIGYLTQKMINEWEAGKFENRRIHSEDLRRVIQDWVLSLPYVNRTDAIPRFHFGPGLYSVFDGGRLAVENDVIFRDLSNHLDHQLLNRWDDLKDAARRFEKQRAGLDARIRMQVVDVFGLNIEPLGHELRERTAAEAG